MKDSRAGESWDNDFKRRKEMRMPRKTDKEDEGRSAQEKVDRAIAELSEEFEDFGWWVQDDMSFLLEELGRELPAGHPLEGRDLAPMARCERNDDVLFHDGKGFLVVHLTWSKSNKPPFPLFREIEDDDIVSFLRNDHLDG